MESRSQVTLRAGSVHTGMLGEVCFQHDGAALQYDGEDKSFWPTDHLTLSSIYLLDLDDAENFGNPTPKKSVPGLDLEQAPLCHAATLQTLASNIGIQIKNWV